nr:MAG TPA: cysteine sulfinate desulfinase/cysteine desulfurase [Caudoviricetes sp.]
MIYLDHAATSPLLQCTKVAFNAASTAVWGNPNSLHSFGQRARNALESSREAVAQCLKCNSDQVFFVSSATEACRIAIARMTEACEKIHVTKVEHAAVTNMTDRKVYSDCRNGNRGFVHIHTNNETGEIYDLRNAFSGYDLTFSDCTAAMGKQEINFRESGIDFICGGGHKFGAPIGIGVLIARNPEAITTNFHFGTPSAPLAAAFAEALVFRTDHIEEFKNAAATLHDRLIDGIMNEVPDAQLNGLLYKGNEIMQSPYIANVSFPNIENHALVLRLATDGLMVSSGAACSSGDNEPSRVLLASGYSEERARSAIRFSFDYKLDFDANDMGNNYGLSLERDARIIDEAVKIVAQNVREMQTLSRIHSKEIDI